MIFGAWNVRSLCRSGSLTAAARKLAKCKLDVVVSRRLGGTKGIRKEQGFIFFLWKKKIIIGTGFFCIPKNSSSS